MKYPRDSRVACSIYLSYPLHSFCVGLNANLAVVLLQMHCQMKLRGSPCSVFSCCNTEISTTFRAGKNFFFLWLPWYNVRLQRFGKASTIPFFLHLSKPFSVMTFLTCSSSLHWLKSEVIFFWFPEQRLVLEETFDFFASYSVGYLWKQNIPLEKVRFSWCLPFAFKPTSAFLVTSERGFTFSLNCNTFAVECDWNRILKTIKIWGFLEI